MDSSFDDGSYNDLVAYEFYPLKSREKRQTQTVSLPPSNPPSVSTSLTNVGTIWMNKTRTVETQGNDKPLLRKSPANNFTPNNGSSTSGTNNATVTDASVPELPEFPEDVEKYAVEHNVTKKVHLFDHLHWQLTIHLKLKPDASRKGRRSAVYEMFFFKFTQLNGLNFRTTTSSTTLRNTSPQIKEVQATGWTRTLTKRRTSCFQMLIEELLWVSDLRKNSTKCNMWWN